MEYLDGWELVPGHDDGGREKISSPKHGCANLAISESDEVICTSQSPPSPISPRLDSEIPTEKEENPTPLIIAVEPDPDRVSPISLENMKETEFVDMKSLDEEEEEEDGQVTKVSDESDGDCRGGGFDLRKWSWGLTGIGALCSFGVATVFVLVLGATIGPGVQVQHKKNMGFKGYEENQRLKEMVSAVKGGSVPLTRAHITFGGYFDDAPSLNH